MQLNPSQYMILAVIAVVVVVVYILAVFLHARHKRRSRVLRSLYVGEDDKVGMGNEPSAFASISTDLLSIIGVKVLENRKKNYKLYGKAGLNSEDAVAKFLFFRYFVQPFVLAIGVFLIFMILAGGGDPLSIDNLLLLVLAFGCALLGIGGHTMVLDKLAIKRREKLMLDFPDATDLLLICVESGMGLDAALARVSRELEHSHPTITTELERTRAELGLSADRVEALQNLAERTDLQSYRSLVSALVQTEKYGTNLAETLRTLSKEYRTARLLKAEEKAAKVGALLTLPVVLLVFFPVMALIMSPPFIQLFASGGLFAN